MVYDSDLDIPGTSRILDESGEVIGQNAITLLPVPSSDPEDPLNWSQPRKNIHLACVIIYTTAQALSSSCLYSIYTPLSASTGLTLDQLNAGTGYSYLFIGLGTLICQPAALAYGKRPMYIASCLICCVLSIWTVYTDGNGQWIANRLLLGFFGAPNFALVEVSIADLFFYHERAWPMGIYVALLYGGACLGPLLSGYIFIGMGWQAVLYLSSGLLGITGIFLWIFCEETNFSRMEADRHAHVQEQVVDAVDQVTEDGEEKKQPTTDVVVNAHVHSTPRTPWPGPRPFHFAKPSPFAGGIMWRGLVQPIALLRSPIIWWCGLMYGIYQIYYNLIAALASGVLSYPPYNFSTGSVGLTFLSPLLATIPGAIFGGWFSDKYTLQQAKKNNGIAEAEHKLKLFLLPTILTPIGLLMIGLGPYYNAHWMVFVAGVFILNIAGPLATLLVLTYAFDTFHSIHPRDRTGVHSAVQDCAPYILIIMVVAMMFTFAFGYAITPWAFTWGLFNFAISAACIATAFNVSVLLILRWGKPLRRSGEEYYRKIINW